MLVFSINYSFAETEPILITQSQSMEKIIFDGKWTNISEWKQSSHDQFSFNNGNSVIHLRTAHFGEYIYIFIDPIHDLTLDSEQDSATVCFDSKNNKNTIHDEDDFCFIIELENSFGKIFQGTTKLENSLVQIDNIDEYIAVSSTSDENDRYSKTPHPSYEFKIPLSLLGRSDNYGFYFSVHDASENKFYSWPTNVTENSMITSPSEWGNMISPDKSLPEIHLPFLILITFFSLVIVITQKQKMGIFRI